GTIARLHVAQGYCKVTGTGTATLAKVGWVNNPSSDARLTVDAGAGAITTLIQVGGYSQINVSVTGIIQGGGLIDYMAGTLSDFIGTAGITNFLVSTTLARAIVAGVCVFDCNKNNITKTVTVAIESEGAMLKYTPGRDAISPTYIGKGVK